MEIFYHKDTKTPRIQKLKTLCLGVLVVKNTGFAGQKFLNPESFRGRRTRQLRRDRLSIGMTNGFII